MFASVGSLLKIHSWSDNQFDQLSTYNPIRGHNPEAKILNVSWCHDNSYLALLPENNRPQILSSKDRTNINLVHTINALKDVSAVTFKNQTKRNIALGNNLGELAIYDTKTRSITSKIASLPDSVKLVEFNCRDEQLAVACYNALSIFIDHEGVNNFVKEIHQPGICTVAKFHPSLPNLLAVGGENGCVTLWDTEKEEKLGRYQKHSASLTGIAFTRNQKLMVTAGMDNKICVLDSSSTNCLFRMNLHQAVTALDISPDDLYLAVGLEDGCIYIYDIRDPLKHLVCSKSHNSRINKIVFEKGPVLVESLHDGHSVTTLNESEFGDINSKFEVVLNNDVEKTETTEDKWKKDLLKMVNTHMAYLENQLAEHCTKFQTFINHEFDSIHNAMARWDVFNVGDTSEIVHAMDTSENRSTKSASTRKSTNYQMSI
ncbi:hypothetical protein NQ314_017337 [Rhamnusium bicolor]|uniref:Uncharacterized protein n=1 Tax=Rhamnusium bicolor TaxID=1586634 RepID=A0AAV8WU48_9CUCU|nr:hypothetical protein NQ314_017337 [Rhamnusium bicolor]